MHFVDVDYDEPFYSSDIFDFYFGDARLGVFDIETTGLGADKAKIVLCGILTPSAGGLRVRQFFSEGAHEEAEILDLCRDEISKLDVLFSFNGDRFDVPFVDKRLAHHHRLPAFADCLSVDMYRVVRAHSQLRSVLPNLKQKTVEDYLGLWTHRSDRISGADSVYLYYEYLATKSEKLLQFILLHNHDDLLQLARILRIFGKLDLHRIAAHTGFPVKSGEASAFVENILLRRKSLEFSGRFKSLPFDYIVFDEAYEVSFQNEEHRFHIRIPCFYESGVTFADLQALRVEDPEVLRLPGCESGYLVLRQGSEIHFGAMNRLIKLILQATLAKFR
ncbi:MAG: ribonuclease H-like domain-containing protein [Clostridiales Family XIII bacterium]|jgi:uncharacterized protein YprB with RNaseH-like and TPR domain|nr:ribonuclease H-like domain-containing protein [Clostridiales Family XIII bacterium]